MVYNSPCHPHTSLPLPANNAWELSNRHGIMWDPSVMYNSTNLHGTQQKGPSVYGQKTWVEFFNFAIIGWFAIN